MHKIEVSLSKVEWNLFRVNSLNDLKEQVQDHFNIEIENFKRLDDLVDVEDEDVFKELIIINNDLDTNLCLLAIEKLSNHEMNQQNKKLDKLKQEYNRRLFQTIETKAVSSTVLNKMEQKLERIKIQQSEKIDFCFLLNCTNGVFSKSYLTLINDLVDKLNDNNLKIKFALVCYRSISVQRNIIILNTSFLEDTQLFKSIIYDFEDLISDETNITEKDYGFYEISQFDWINETRILFHISHYFTDKYKILLNTLSIYDINYYFAGKLEIVENSNKINFLELDKIKLDLVIESIMDKFSGKFDQMSRCMKIRTIDSKIPDWKNLNLFREFKADYFAVNYLNNLKEIKSDNLSYNHTVCQIWIKEEPFSKGAMRFAYPAVLNLGAENSDCLLNCVVKESIFLGSEYNTKKYHEESLQIQVISSYLAHKFSQIYKSESKLKFLDVDLIHINETGYYYSIEHFVEGIFKKWMNNEGNVNLEEYSSLLNAFSHWTFEYTQGYLIVTDLQGFVYKNNEFILTDPALVCSDEPNRFGLTNRGFKSVYNFFEKHQCNYICRFLKLKKHFKQILNDIV